MHSCLVVTKTSTVDWPTGAVSIAHRPASSTTARMTMPAGPVSSTGSRVGEVHQLPVYGGSPRTCRQEKLNPVRYEPRLNHAIACGHRERWLEAMLDELSSLSEYGAGAEPWCAASALQHWSRRPAG